MDQSEFYAWVPLENFLSQLGKKIKKEYEDDFGKEPPDNLPHPIKGSTHRMYPAYYPKPWLKARLGV